MAIEAWDSFRAGSFRISAAVEYGHIHQPSIGALVQTITPELAEGLHLGRDFGVVVSDITPGGPADKAGLRIQDVIVSVDGAPIGSLPLFSHTLNLHKTGENAKVVVLRGSERVQLDIVLAERPLKADSLVDMADPDKNLIRPLSILGIELTLELAQTLPDAYSNRRHRGRQNPGVADCGDSPANRRRNSRFEWNNDYEIGWIASRAGEAEARYGYGAADRTLRPAYLRVGHALTLNSV